MVKQYAATGKNIVALLVVQGDPVRIKFGNAIGTAWMENCFFVLRGRMDLTKHFRGTGLIKTNLRID